MIEKWPISIPELSGKKQRSVYVYVPDEADSDPEARFPVLYMFDGHNVFFDKDATYGKSWGMLEYMKETRTPVIIVAVECNHGKHNERLKEYAPFTFSFTHEGKKGRITGKGSTYMNWMVSTLKPHIDQTYPTLPERETTWIAGSSMGGLMSLYAVAQHNEVFSRAACLSPSVWACSKRLTECIRQSAMSPDTVVYMDYGTREMAFRQDMRSHYIRVMDALMAKPVLLTSRMIPNGDHCEACWEEQIPFFMNTLLYQRD